MKSAKPGKFSEITDVSYGKSHPKLKLRIFLKIVKGDKREIDFMKVTQCDLTEHTNY
jgi:hypothetical protein